MGTPTPIGQLDLLLQLHFCLRFILFKFFIEKKSSSIPGWCNSSGSNLCGTAFLPWDHDVLGPGVWSALDFSVLLLHLDLSFSSAFYGYQVWIFLEKKNFFNQYL